MHQSSMDKMTAFRDRYLTAKQSQPLRILDLGSQDVNGSYRPLFSKEPWKYIGLDRVAGHNVDIVLHTPYIWSGISGESADVVISGQALEHIEYFWITILEVARVLKPGGLCCILAPSSGPEHRYPRDCWRFYPDGLISLARYAQMEVLEAATQWQDLGYADGSDLWHDSMLVCRKPDKGVWRNKKGSLQRWLKHWTIRAGMK
ncbi:MAG: class I SAM-dependent methyltransferase [Deltaproteobacteria bacterium]|nr:class I SAM-dependent methyltransferase [Deltaproteobacteria bacterium]